MKKLAAILLITVMVFSTTACGGKKCSQCGNRVDKGYTVAGNFICEKCMW